MQPLRKRRSIHAPHTCVLRASSELPGQVSLTPLLPVRRGQEHGGLAVAGLRETCSFLQAWSPPLRPFLILKDLAYMSLRDVFSSK